MNNLLTCCRWSDTEPPKPIIGQSKLNRNISSVIFEKGYKPYVSFLVKGVPQIAEIIGFRCRQWRGAFIVILYECIVGVHIIFISTKQLSFSLFPNER